MEGKGFEGAHPFCQRGMTKSVLISFETKGPRLPEVDLQVFNPAGGTISEAEFPRQEEISNPAEAMHTFMTTPLIKKLNIWGLGFLCPPCSWTCAPREKYQALLVWSLPSVWVASCSSEGTHTDNHIPFQTSNARRNNTLRRRIRRGANKLAPPFKGGPATYVKLAPIGRT